MADVGELRLRAQCGVHGVGGEEVGDGCRVVLHVRADAGTVEVQIGVGEAEVLLLRSAARTASL